METYSFFLLAGFCVMLCVKTKELTDTTNCNAFFSFFFFFPKKYFVPPKGKIQNESQIQSVLKVLRFLKVLCPKFTVVWFLFEITIPSSHEDLCISDLADVSTEKYMYGK